MIGSHNLSGKVNTESDLAPSYKQSTPIQSTSENHIMKSNTKYKALASLIAGGGLMIATAQAATVMIDFGTTNAKSLVQSGFTAQTSGAATSYSTPAGNITVASTGSFFNRSADATFTDAPLMGDFTFANNLATNAMTITIAGVGIAPNTAYDIKFYSYDSQHTSGGGTVTYAGLSGTAGGTSIAYSNAGSTNPGFADSNSSLTSWTSNGSGEIVIGVTGTTEGPRVNGMEITVIPEPSAALLGGLGLLALLRRRR